MAAADPCRHLPGALAVAPETGAMAHVINSSFIACAPAVKDAFARAAIEGIVL
jgi:hypothetical protein